MRFRPVAVMLSICVCLATQPVQGDDQAPVVPAASTRPSSTPIPSSPIPSQNTEKAERQKTPDLAGSAPDGSASAEFVYELDPYYTEVSVHFPLSDRPIPEMVNANEFEVYRKLFVDSLIPRFMLIEAAVFPMPLTGVALKRYTPEFYKNFNVGNRDLNLLEAVTAGFQEPYAFSIFLGDMVSFVKPGQDKVSANKGYMGYMLSYSNQHIKRNVLIPDNNFEVEWKMKGDRIFKEDKLSWSFRAGAKIHEHSDIANTLYLGFRRSNLDFHADFLSFLNNSSIDFRWDFSARNGRILRQEYVIGKKFPVRNWRVAFRMDVGVIWEDPARYTGSLRDKDFQSVTAVLRPNIEF